jgi:hypothetical protein
VSSAVRLSAKICWLLAAAIAGLGYVAVVGPSEVRIADLDERSDALLARVLADEQAAKDVDRLAQLQHDISGELGGVNLGSDRAGVVAEFLRDVEARVRSRHVRLVSVQNASAITSGATHAVAPTPGDPFEAASVEIVLEGSYDSVLRTIADLSRSRVLMKIEQSSIDRAKGRQDDRSPLLAVQLKLAILYLRAAPLPSSHESRGT